MTLKAKKIAGRPIDWTAPARAEIKQLRGDAKRLESVAKRLREKARDLSNEIKVQRVSNRTEKGEFMSFKSSFSNASIAILPANKEQAMLDAMDRLFD